MGKSDLFEYCVRNKVRVSSSKGLLDAEQLWDLRLQGGSLNLDDLYKAINKKIKDSQEESFLNPSSSTAITAYEVQLELLKHIMTTKVQEAKDKADSTKRKEEKASLLEVLSEIEKKELGGLSKEEVLKKLAALK